MTADEVRYSKPLSVERNLSLALERRGSFFRMPSGGHNRLTKEEVIARFRAVHGDKYDYSKIEYKGKDVKVCIICPIHGEFWQTPHSHWSGNGCPKCAHEKTRQRLNSNTEEFITRAKEIHGDFYDYSKVNYKDSQTKVCIICPIHGEFWQIPNKHLQGQGCPKCGRARTISSHKITNEEFIKRAIWRHGDMFDYSKVDCENGNDKVCIICHKKDKNGVEHGSFWQNIHSHLSGCGCRKCGYESVSKNLVMTADEFIRRARNVHGDFYDYSKVEYKGMDKKVCIICPIHGEFWQEARSHLSGCGCPRCVPNFKKNTESFISKAREVHGDRYDYSLVEYKSSTEKVCIICKKHGVFWQKPANHLQGEGCPYCSHSRGEELVMQWLVENNIDFVSQYWITPQQVLFGTKKFKVDFFIPSINTIIEYNGCQHYKMVKYWHKDEDGLINQQERDRRLREHCKQHKIRLIEIPYTEIDNIDKILTKKILKSKKI